MKHTTLMTNLCAALALATTTAVDAGRGMGMGGCGPGMMDGGPGMMGGGMGGGMGMMGCGMGMMGGGMGMMGGGMGMMHGGMGALYALDLNEDQQNKVMQIQNEVGKKHWDLMGKMNDEHGKLHSMMMADKRDPAAVGQQMEKVFDLRRQMMESSIDAQNRIDAVLTAEQRTKLRDMWQKGGCPMAQ